MEGRKPTGVLLVMVNNTAPEKEAEFNHWYNEVHLADVCGTGSYYAATRFENPDAKPGEARYVPSTRPIGTTPPRPSPRCGSTRATWTSGHISRRSW